MIKIEDRELEAAVLAGNSCIAVPFEIWVPQNGEVEITVYSCFEKVARLFEVLFAHEPLKADALNWIDDKLYATVKEFGYVHAAEDIHFLCEYVAEDVSHLQNAARLADVKIINGEDELAGVDKSLIEEILVNDTSAVFIENEKLVCIACTNDVCFADGSVELYVETDAEHRGKGYAAAAVTALARHYLEQGIVARYKCAKANTPSIGVAEKCGFVKTGERYAYVCYAIGEK